MPLRKLHLSFCCDEEAQRWQAELLPPKDLSQLELKVLVRMKPFGIVPDSARDDDHRVAHWNGAGVGSPTDSPAVYAAVLHGWRRAGVTAGTAGRPGRSVGKEYV